jgi:hypothetical protein
VESRSQQTRHDSSRIVTAGGGTIDLRDEQPENALASVRLSLQVDSNVSIESRQQK